MPISSHEDWVQIAELDDQDQIRFTAEFRALMGDLGWEAKAFVGHLLGLWYDPFEHLLVHQRRGILLSGPAWPVRPQRVGRAARGGRVLGGRLEQARKLPRATSPSRLRIGLERCLVPRRPARQAGVAAPAATASAGVQGKDRVASQLLSVTLARKQRT